MTIFGNFTRLGKFDRGRNLTGFGIPTSRTVYCIQVEFHNNFSGFSTFGFCGKVTRMKTQQVTYKAREHNGRIVILRRRTSGDEFVFYNLPSLHFTSPLVVATYFLSSF